MIPSAEEESTTESAERVFIEAMECLPVPTVPEGPEWTYEIKLDGYRLEAVRSAPARRHSSLSQRENVPQPEIRFHRGCAETFARWNRDRRRTRSTGRQRGVQTSICFKIFAPRNLRFATSSSIFLCIRNRDLTRLPLSERREILRSVIEPTEHIGLSEVSERTAAEMLKFVREHGLEGLVAKRTDGAYQPGLRSGSWSKAPHQPRPGVRSRRIRAKQSRPRFLGRGILSRSEELIYASRVRAGFIPATRRKVFDQIKHPHDYKVPIRQSPRARSGGGGVRALLRRR